MTSFRLGAVGGWAGAVLMSLAAMAGAQTNIDTFDDAHPFLGAPPTTGSTEPGTFVIGGERDLQVERISGAGTVGAGVSDNMFIFSSTGALTAGEAQITYDGTDGDAAALAATGLGGVNLTAGGADGLFLNVLTTSGPSVILVEVYTSATRSSLYTLQLPEVIAPTTYALAFAAFRTHLGTGADFTSVGAVVVTVRGTDVSIILTGLRADVLPGPAIGATMTDALANDVDADTRADSGDTLRYTVTIANAPNAAAATGTELTTNLEPNTALVAGSIQTSPLAIDDYYFSFNPLVIAAPGVLGNDVDADGDAVTVVGGGVPRPTSRGGSVTLNADGSFSYTPPADGTVDTFTYEVTDGNGITGSGVVTVARLVNAPPIVTAATALAYTENQAATAISPALTVTDADNTNLAGATVQITGNYVSGEDVLGFTNVGAITGSFNATTGTVTLTGSDTVANYQAALRAVTYRNTFDNPSPLARSVTWIATDGTASSDPVTTEITITTANDAPVVTAGGTLAYTENDPATAIDPAITVSDADSTNLVGATAQITGGYQNGQDVLSYATALGISGTFDAPSGTLTLTGTTTVANYQAALRTVTYRNTSENPSPAARTITWIATDDAAAPSTAVTSTITVAAVNDIPVVTAGGTLAYTENQAPAAIDPGITVIDVDSANLASASVQITANFAAGQDLLSFTDTANIASSYNAGTGTLTLTGADTVANYQAALRAVSYENSSENPSTLSRTVSFTVNDGTASSAAATSTVTVTAVNDAPVVTAGNILAYTENQAAASVSPALTVSDVDSTNLTAATVQITGNYLETEDVLSFVNTANITGTFTSATGTLALAGTDTLANYQAALRSVAYHNTSEAPSILARTVTWTATDQNAAPLTSAPATSTITVASVNDAPVLTAGATLSYTENDPAAVVDGGVTVADVDSTNLTQATVQITVNYQNGQDVLSFATLGPIGGTFSAATGTLTLTGTDTVANYQTALRTVKYNNTSDTPATAARTVQWRATDGTTESATGVTSTINVTAVNDAPVVTAGNTLSYTEGGAAAAVAPAITVSDVDSTNLVGATVQITVNYQNGQDVLSYVTVLGISGSFDAPSGTLTLSGTTTVANYQAALRSVLYNNTSDDPNTAARTVTWRVDDGSALNNLSNQATSTINVTAVNDAPVVTTTGGITAFVVAGGPVVVDNALTVTDVDNANLASATVTITNPQDGPNEVLAATSCGTLTVTPGLNSLAISGSQPVADYQACLRSVTYNDTAASPNTLPRTIRFVANDGTANSANADKLVDAAPRVSTTTPANAAINVAASSNIVVNFSESVTVSGGSFTLECPTGSPQAFGFSGSTTNVSTVTLDPTTNLPSGVTCTLTVIASQVTDSDTADGPNNMTANQVFTFGVPPLAVADTYPQTVTGNVGINSAMILYSVNSNDVSVLAYNITAFDPTTINGGQVIMTTPSGAGQGQFTYNPPAGFEGNDTFTYTITNAGGSSTATVTIPVSGMIWFVKGDASTCTTRATGCGRLSNPYSSLDSFRAENNGTNPALNPANGDNIFVYQNATAYTTTGGLTLLTNQKLIGQDATASLAAITGLTPGSASAPLPPMDTNAPATTISHAGGNQSAITLGLGNTLRGLSVSTGSSSTTGIGGAAVGNFTSAEVIVSGSGPAVNINGGTLAASFFSLSSTGSASSGILLNNTTGSFTVTGDGASDPANSIRGRTIARQGGGGITLGSGGTINNTTGPAISLTNATTVTLRNLSLTGNTGGVNSGADGIRAQTVTGLTLDNVLITGHLGNDGLSGNGVSGLSLLHTDIHTNATTAGVEAFDIWNVRLDNLTGTSVVTNSLFFDALEDVFAITNGGSSSLTLTVTNSEFRDTLATGAGNVAFAMLASGNAVTNLTITGSTFKGAKTTGLQYGGNGSSSGTVTVTTNVFGGTAAGSDAGKQNGVDVNIGHQGAGTQLLFDVSGNTTRQGFRANTSDSISIFLGGLPSGGTLMTGSVKNNVIGTAGVADSGSDLGAGIALGATGDGTLTATVTNNNVNQVRAFSANVFDAGIFDNAKLNLKIRSNIFNGSPAEPNPQYGLHINNGTGGIPGESGVLCMDMGANSVTVPATSFAAVGLEVFTGTNSNLIGYGGAANDEPAIQTFLDTTNTIVTPPAVYTTDGGGSTQAAVPPCSTFVFPP